MMADRVKPPSSDDPFKKGKVDKSDELDDEKKRVEKASEVDPEGKKRRKFKQYLDKEDKDQEVSEQKPSPYEPTFHEKSPYESPPVDQQKEKPVEKVKPKETTSEPAKEVPKSPPKEPSYTESVKPPPSLIKEAKEVKSTAKLPSRPEERTEQQKFEKTNHFETKEEVEPIKEEAEQTITPAIQPLPQDILQKASAITNDLKVYLNSEIAPLFEQMVGRMVIMSTEKGIMQTEIELTSANFENSVFYGSKIVLEKYSTAPDSFNIQLTGTPEAVAIFNANVDNLMEAFQRANLNFRIGRLEAAYETTRPLFKRKKPPTTNSEGEGSVR